MRRIACAFAFLAALCTSAFAQGIGLPFYPLTSVPAKTFIGNPSAKAGPVSAIPFATAQALLAGASETLINDANYAMVSTDQTLVYTGLSVSRTVTLLPASTFNPGTKFYLYDRSGSASSAKTISIAPSGSDNINGANTTLTVINGAYGYIILETDGISKWTAGLVSTAGIPANTITNALLAQMATSTLKCQPTTGPANAQDCTLGAAFAFSGSVFQTVAFTGDVTTPANSVATTIAANVVTNAKAAQMAANTIKSNITSATANAGDNAIGSMPWPNRNYAARFGSMDVWQRGAGASASIAVAASTTAYTVDGCYIVTGTNEASTIAAVTGIAAGSNKAAAITRNSGQTGTGAVVFGCPFDTDEIALFAGKSVVLSFTASTGANWSPTSGNVQYTLFCGTGSVKKQSTGYTNQTTPIQTTVAIAAGTSAARYQSTSASAVAANCTQAEIQFTWTPVGTAGGADTLTIDDIQLETALNSTQTATPFEQRDFEDQLHKAQRHYTKTFPYGTAPAQSAGLAGALVHRISGATPGVNVGPFADWRYPRQMRSTPSVTTFNPSASNANWRDATASADFTVSVDPNSSASADHTTIGSTAQTGVSGDYYYIHGVADAGI